MQKGHLFHPIREFYHSDAIKDWIIKVELSYEDNNYHLMLQSQGDYK